MSSTSERHKKGAPKSLGFGVATVSMSRSHNRERDLPISDISGDLISDLLVQAGHKVICRSIVADDQRRIGEWIESALRNPEIDVLITCGGTGISMSDVTIETVKKLFNKELPGFGEIFRMLSYKKMGSAAFVSRAVAGISKGKVIFCIPGSPDAVRLAIAQLVLPEAGHIVRHIRE